MEENNAAMSPSNLIYMQITYKLTKRMLFLKPNHHHPVYNNYNLKIVSYILLYKRNPKNNTPIFGKYLKKMSAVEPETYVLFTSVIFTLISFTVL